MAIRTETKAATTDPVVWSWTIGDEIKVQAKSDTADTIMTANTLYLKFRS